MKGRRDTMMSNGESDSINTQEKSGCVKSKDLSFSLYKPNKYRDLCKISAKTNRKKTNNQQQQQQKTPHTQATGDF
jgi:hypothetical protein